MITFAHNTKEALELIEKEYDTKNTIINHLRERIKELEDEAYKDIELQEMKEELDKMKKDYRNGFQISEYEKEAINEWKKEHEEEVHGLRTDKDKLRAQGVCGGRYKYVFVPTSIGTSGKIVCSCGAEFEFQEIG